LPNWAISAGVEATHAKCRYIASGSVFAYTLYRFGVSGSANTSPPDNVVLLHLAAFIEEQGASMKSILSTRHCVSAFAPTLGAGRVDRLRVICCVGVAAVILSAPGAFAQKLYKHVDEKGVVTYTDRPEEAAQKPIKIDNLKRNGDKDSQMNRNLQNQKQRSDANWQAEQQGAQYQKERQESTSSTHDSSDSDQGAVNPRAPKSSH
jgi:hypothetical protein